MGTRRRTAKWLLLCAMICALLCSCSTSRVVERVEVPVVVERVSHDSVRAVRVNVERDTIVQRDSVVVRVDGVDRWHIREVMRWRERVDTLMVVRVDSVPVVTETERVVTIEKKPSLLQRLKMAAWGLIVGAVVAVIFFVWVRKW